MTRKAGTLGLYVVQGKLRGFMFSLIHGVEYQNHESRILINIINYYVE